MTPLATSFEELVLLAIREGAEPTGGRLQGWLTEATGKRVTVGALYTTLERAEKKGLVRKTAYVLVGESGRESVIYALTDLAKKELQRAQGVRERVAEVARDGNAS